MPKAKQEKAQEPSPVSFKNTRCIDAFFLYNILPDRQLEQV